ncbi:hypothetical protein OG21DRAFT_1527881 [Imleria badia]|nr:hypothetical protein OG21DRAFT_1527881 [Imleria badia]
MTMLRPTDLPHQTDIPDFQTNRSLSAQTHQDLHGSSRTLSGDEPIASPKPTPTRKPENTTSDFLSPLQCDISHYWHKSTVFSFFTHHTASNLRAYYMPPNNDWHLIGALPLLPAKVLGGPDVHHAHELLQDAYQRAVALLQQEDIDPLHVHIHADQISQRMVPLLEALQNEVEDTNWITTCANPFGKLLCVLENLVLSASGQDQSTVIHAIPVATNPPGLGHGRPHLEFDLE